MNRFKKGHYLCIYWAAFNNECELRNVFLAIGGGVIGDGIVVADNKETTEMVFKTRKKRDECMEWLRAMDEPMVSYESI